MENRWNSNFSSSSTEVDELRQKLETSEGLLQELVAALSFMVTGSKISHLKKAHAEASSFLTEQAKG